MTVRLQSQELSWHWSWLMQRTAFEERYLLWAICFIWFIFMGILRQWNIIVRHKTGLIYFLYFWNFRFLLYISIQGHRIHYTRNSFNIITDNWTPPFFCLPSDLMELWKDTKKVSLLNWSTSKNTSGNH